VVHCVSQAPARQVLAALVKRMAGVGPALHPDKTRIGYCKDGNRRGSYEHTAFTFLGYPFRPRGVRTKTGRMFTGFHPAIGRDALTKIGGQVRSWALRRRTEVSEADLAERVNPVVRGWMNYYGAFYRSALYPLLTRINAYVMRWSRNKYKRLRNRKLAQAAWDQAVALRPRFFAHWVWVNTVPAVW
jgi:RNA-directed DNA polymerase